MSPKQLRLFAREEFGVDLPDADQEILFDAVLKLTRSAPQNNNRLILMAHTMKMNYDETLAQIEHAVNHPDATCKVETFEFEIYQ